MIGNISSMLMQIDAKKNQLIQNFSQLDQLVMEVDMPPDTVSKIK